ncbi:MAG: histidine kinase N-terminal 7TM domain-containing protein [Anaerolineales bacterium]|nr:histidine kinase N-terminal 7TM domain-containing protein [Anaerolineales bacterium]
MSPFVSGLATLSQILASGIVITAFSLLLYALTFNLRDRVARSFAGLLAFITVVYFCDVVISTLTELPTAEFWLRFQWLGIASIPAAYLHFSDALLATTGQPSRGRRRFAIRVLYLLALAFLAAALFTDNLVKSPVLENGVGRLRAGFLFPVFLAYSIGSLSWAGWNFVRAYRRCQTSTARRRMLYLMVSAAAPLLGTFPFLLIAGQTASLPPLIFWTLVIVTNAAVSVLLLVMAYTVAYFGVTQPDRVIKARFFQWFLRGPVVASTVLAVYVIVTRYGPRLPFYDPRAVPFLLVAVLLLLQYLITLVRLPIERALFYGADRLELRRLQTLEERLLTTRDLQQFFESVLAALCDALRSPSAFLAAFNERGKIEYEVAVGSAVELRTKGELPPLSALRTAPVELPGLNGRQAELFPGGLFAWGEYWIVPLRGANSGEALGLLGVQAGDVAALSAEQAITFSRLCARAAAALEDRRLQRDVFQALDRLLPDIEQVQRMRASVAYTGAERLAAPESPIDAADLPAMIKDALSHYWGGPKLTESPLLRLRVVQNAIDQHDGNAVNALRAVLREALESIKPEGQRKTTTEWLLYNILEMKFLQGERVRDVAARLAVSEADLYRKQRVALEKVAEVILARERAAARREPT